MPDNFKTNNMNKLLILSAMLWITVTLISCNGDKGSKDILLKHYKNVYNLSISYNDYFSAENATYQELILDTANASYKDTLANLYFKNGQYEQAIALGKEILTKSPNDLPIMGMVGKSDENINNLDEALYYYQTIYTKIHDLFHLYKIATLQFDLSRMVECNQTIDQILADSASAHQKIPIADVPGQTPQIVSYKAAALNIRGVIAKGLKQTDVARRAFNDALAADPDFALAKTNLEELNK
jgi:tetratricopeptide (TPR) repeat protein